MHPGFGGLYGRLRVFEQGLEIDHGLDHPGDIAGGRAAEAARPKGLSGVVTPATANQRERATAAASEASSAHIRGYP